MRIITTVHDMQLLSVELHREEVRIGFVPTMGSLHEGHLSLIRIAKQNADKTVVSLFVNPTQFGPDEDLQVYPRNPERDEALCRKEGVDYLFFPQVDEMYAPTASVFVDESSLTQGLCGAGRPGHFRGVLTVVAKLFNIVCPDVAVFGEKDAQQLRVIQQLVADLNISVRIVSGPIVREADGLAMSSRNARLSMQEREQALCLRKALDLAETLYGEGEENAIIIVEQMRRSINLISGVRIDYIEIVDWETLQPLDFIAKKTLIALAVFVGRTRLIDNTIIGEE